MAFFKFRKAAGETAAPAPAPESVEAMRKRARYRLAGAALLVLLGVVGFPILFDNQPRPIAVDIPIDIPDKAKAKPLAMAEAATEAKAANESAPAPITAQAVTGPVTPHASATPGNVSPKESLAVDKEEVIVTPPKPESKPEAKKAEKPADKSADKPTDRAAAGRFVVQFGAFTESARAHEARLKVEKTGMKTYAQIAEGPEGKKFRVRVGPFEKRSDAEKAAEMIKKLGLPAAILEL